MKQQHTRAGTGPVVSPDIHPQQVKGFLFSVVEKVLATGVISQPAGFGQQVIPDAPCLAARHQGRPVHQTAQTTYY